MTPKKRTRAEVITAIIQRDRTLPILLHFEREQAELTIAIDKYLKGEGTRKQISEEIADVRIMLEFIPAMLGLDKRDEEVKYNKVWQLMEQELNEGRHEKVLRGHTNNLRAQGNSVITEKREKTHVKKFMEKEGIIIGIPDNPDNEKITKALQQERDTVRNDKHLPNRGDIISMLNLAILHFPFYPNRIIRFYITKGTNCPQGVDFDWVNPDKPIKKFFYRYNGGEE